MTDKLIMTTKERDLVISAVRVGQQLNDDRDNELHQDELSVLSEAITMLQSLPMVSGEPENKDVVELYGMKDGIQVHLGQAPTPPRMKAKEIVTSMFGHFDEHDDMDDGDAALCFSCMTELIDYMQKLPKPSPQALTPITADDVTDEMLGELNTNTHPASTRAEILAAAYNAVITHRSEAR